MSLVLIIISAVLSTMAMPLSHSIQQARHKRTATQLVIIREALHGYLISRGRLPCPESLIVDAIGIAPNSAAESSRCVTAHGSVPAQALGLIGERDSDGRLLDAWGRSYHYSVSLDDNATVGNIGSPDWLTVGEPAAVGASNLNAELQLCRVAASSQCPKKDLIANQIAWVVYSSGESDNIEGIEAENSDEDTVFAVSAYSSNNEQPFDDQLIWASRSELVYWLLKANWLP